tara:strand:- start:259 stop:660 length:402 start_codon:yes stop_codon:yes gene_type:complete
MFFKKDENDDLIDVCALLIHAAKIDENYSLKEEKIIKQTLQLIGAEKEKLEEIIKSAKIIENDSNQILSFTKKVKNMNNENKIRIIEALWKIIYSNNDADIYETNLMRRLGGLLYIDNKIMGDIKEKIRKESL